MSQVPVSPGQGFDTGEDQVIPSSPSVDANGAPDFDTLLGKALLEDLGVPPDAPADSDSEETGWEDLADPEAQLSATAEPGTYGDDGPEDGDAEPERTIKTERQMPEGGSAGELVEADETGEAGDREQHVPRALPHRLGVFRVARGDD